MATVYHLRKEFLRAYSFGFGDYEPNFPEDYERVAVVAEDDLDDAYRLTNHITHDWTRNANVLAKTDRPRSTSVGDVIKTEDGKAYRVANVGFDLLNGEES